MERSALVSAATFELSHDVLDGGALLNLVVGRFFVALASFSAFSFFRFSASSFLCFFRCP